MAEAPDVQSEAVVAEVMAVDEVRSEEAVVATAELEAAAAVVDADAKAEAEVEAAAEVTAAVTAIIQEAELHGHNYDDSSRGSGEIAVGGAGINSMERMVVLLRSI